MLFYACGALFGLHKCDDSVETRALLAALTPALTKHGLTFLCASEGYASCRRPLDGGSGLFPGRLAAQSLNIM